MKSPLAGKPAPAALLTDIPRLVSAYYTLQPDVAIPAQRVSFGTSGHRGSSLEGSFNQWHILAISQAIADYRIQQGISGPLFLGIDTHALSEPAMRSAVEVLAGNGVELRLAVNDDYTPTPVISHAILTHNRGRTDGLADGIVITPSHNPPKDGGFKYNPPHGGPAGTDVTTVIQARANDMLANGLSGLKRLTYAAALAAETTKRHDYLNSYVGDLGAVIDLDAVRGADLDLAVDPLGGAGVHYWQAIADRYRLRLTIVNEQVDHTFRFMTVDWDGKIRMDPSSADAMQSLISLKDRFDVAFACDTDHDRHGIVAKSVGLLPANHYLAACAHYLFANRPDWSPEAALGKTVVSSSIIDCVADKARRRLFEVPVGFKYFVDGLLVGRLGFVGEESAGSTFLRRDGTVWTTDKDGIAAALLAAEMTARTGRDPGEIYSGIAGTCGVSFYERVDAPATREQKARLARLSAEAVKGDLAGEPIRLVLTHAPGDSEAIGGVKVVSDGGWFAARPSGTEEIYKIYGESLRSAEHLRAIQADAQRLVSAALGASAT